MPKRFLAILVLAFFLPQAAMGGLRGRAMVCLGGGHEHHVEHSHLSADGDCITRCAHDAPADPWVPTITAGEHGCSCTDVEIALVDLSPQPRDGPDTPNPIPSFPVLIAIVDLPRPAIPECRAPSRPGGDPGGSQRAAVVRSTRLNI